MWWGGPRFGPPLAAKRRNSRQRRKVWIASSQGLLAMTWRGRRFAPSLRAKRSNPGQRRKVWIASSQGLLAMTGRESGGIRETALRLHHGEPTQRDALYRRHVKFA